jgi:hypothetical protein
MFQGPGGRNASRGILSNARSSLGLDAATLAASKRAYKDLASASLTLVFVIG